MPRLQSKGQSAYTPYNEIPPPGPEERAALMARFTDMYERQRAVTKQKRHAWLMQWADFAP